MTKIIAAWAACGASASWVEDIWKRPPRIEEAMLAMEAHHAQFITFDSIEPYTVCEPTRLTMWTGEVVLARRCRPGPTGFDLSAQCWTMSRTPACCLQEGGKHCGFSPENVIRCCAFSEDMHTRVMWSQMIMFSGDLTLQDRVLWDALIPQTALDEHSFLAKRLEWRLGFHTPIESCASTTFSEMAPVVGMTIKAILEVLDQVDVLSYSVLNIGAGTCDWRDPLHLLFHSALGYKFTGLLLDANASDLTQCFRNLENGSLASLSLVQMGAEPKTVSSDLRPLLIKLFHGSNPRLFPLDLLVVDIDGCDCTVVEELLRGLVVPKVLVIEIAFAFPPPFRFSQQHDSTYSATWLEEFDVTKYNPTAGCSLSYALHHFRPFGLHLLRLLDTDAVFVHDSVRPVFERVLGVQFPQDEFLCYRNSKLQVHYPIHFVREWFFSEHPADSLAYIWRNITQVQHQQGRTDTPFVLDY